MSGALTKDSFTVKPAVHEQPVKVGGTLANTLMEWNGYSPPTVLNAQFTDFDGLAGMLNLVTGYSLQCQLRDCWIGPGSFEPQSPYTIQSFTNNLFERATLYVGTFDWLCHLYFYNNTVRYSTVQFDNDYGANGYRTVRDNPFDNSTLTVAYPNYVAYSNNAYFASSTSLTPYHTGDFTLTELTYADGPLGNRYIDINNTSPSLVDAGSESASAAGLWSYSILTNQIPDSGMVDIGYHYKITGNDSTGTDFWLAFFSIEAQGEQYLPVEQSLNISSPVATTGTVTYPVNGPVLTITGDPTVSGTYILTNTPESETNDFIGPTMYVNETNTNLQVVSAQFTFYNYYWAIWSYDPTNGYHIAYYTKNDPYLNGTNWARYFGTGTVTSSCPQVPFSQPFSVTPGMVTNVPLPQDTMLYQFDAVESQGIHVTASQPVSVYGFDYYPGASTAFTAYPTPMLGTNYCVMARASSIFGKSYHSQFAVVGTVANTTVTITPSTNAGLAGSMWTNSFILNQGNTYQINSSNIEGDVTGTWIASDKPIAVFGGADFLLCPANPLKLEIR